MTALPDVNSIMQMGYLGLFFVMMFFGQKLQLMQMLAVIGQKLKKLGLIRDASYRSLKAHLEKYKILTDEDTKRLGNLITSIAIPPVTLDTNGIVPKIEGIFKTYEKYLKANIRRIIGDRPQVDIENITNSLEVAIELDIFYRVVDHFFRQAKKGGIMMAYMLVANLPQLMEMADALQAASNHFQTGLPIGDSFGPMVARQFGGAETIYSDEDTTVRNFKEGGDNGRNIFIIKAKGPGGSVGNPAKAIEELVKSHKVDLAVTIDAGLRMESEKTGDLNEGVGTAMGGNGTERFRIEAALQDIPTMTIVCKMTMKEAISMMHPLVLKQVEPAVERVKQMIREYSDEGETVIIVGVGNTMGVD